MLFQEATTQPRAASKRGGVLCFGCAPICGCSSAGADGKATPFGISTKARHAGELICSQSRSPQYAQWLLSVACFCFFFAGARRGAGGLSLGKPRGPLLASAAPSPACGGRRKGTSACGPARPPSAGHPSHAPPHGASSWPAVRLPWALWQ